MLVCPALLILPEPDMTSEYLVSTDFISTSFSGRRKHRPYEEDLCSSDSCHKEQWCHNVKNVQKLSHLHQQGALCEVFQFLEEHLMGRSLTSKEHYMRYIEAVNKILTAKDSCYADPSDSPLH